MQRAAAAFGDLYRVITDDEVEHTEGMTLTGGRKYDFETSTTSVKADGTHVRYVIRMSDLPIPALSGHKDGRTVDVYVDGAFLRAAPVTSSPTSWSVRFRSLTSKHVLISSDGEPPHEITLEAFPYHPAPLPSPRLFRR